jgi:hypothetical protein
MPIQDRPATSMLDHFASGLARTGEISRAAASLGRGLAWGRQRFAEICAELNVPSDPADEQPVDISDIIAAFDPSPGE